jgi:hypothetical protein
MDYVDTFSEVTEVTDDAESTGGEKDSKMEYLSNNMVTSKTSDEDSAYPTVMALNVGGRKFQTMSNTLRTESGLFRHQLSGRFTWTAQNDGTYFLDADPDLFEHLLRFMRRPEVFPLFYSKANGFDYDLYNRLEAEAEYFQVEPLLDWIKDKRYLQAIVTHTYAADTRNLNEILPDTLSITQTEDRSYIPRIRKVYLCPRQIDVHRGDPNRCGAACRKAQLGNEVQFEEEPYVVVVRVKKEVECMSGVCTLN